MVVDVLPSKIVRVFFLQDEGLRLMRQHWARRRKLPGYHQSCGDTFYFLYLALQGKDWRKAFVPPKHQRLPGSKRTPRLAATLQDVHYRTNSAHVQNDYDRDVLLKPFGGGEVISSRALPLLRSFLPKSFENYENLYAYEIPDETILSL